MHELTIRQATADDAEGLWALIHAHEREGHLLPRQLAEIRRHAGRFVVAELPAAAGGGSASLAGGRIVACAELAPLSERVAEVRSLVVSNDVRRGGLASRLVDRIRARAASLGFETLCAFTHDARFFVRQNFSIVPHTWLPEKISTDCLACPLFKTCGQHAMMLPLVDIPRYGRPSAAATAARAVAVA